MKLTAHIIYSFLFFLLLAGQASAGPSVQEITAALDRARGPADVSRQVVVLETVASAPRPSVEALTQLARAYYLLGEAEKDKTKKAAWLDKSVASADRALKAPGMAAPHAVYWRSMALLLKADIASPLKALGYVKEALRGLEAVSAADPAYDFAGAYRSRGKVLIDAPSWAFIGDKKEGLKLLLKAKEIAPGNLVNRLYLAQGYLKNGYRREAVEELSYIMSAPVDKDDKDALDVKEEAKELARRERT